ncbi:zinc-ribbon and DUF3426 domain-containing protein [Methyloterricola oryzae]|uniref:zinc-ribbon and DUF3426 domain-containing protein n=1 Tax=Methyloterricola oryzae TaxID=1495050 RepID=UPI0005EB5E9B|nr:zinc-ribbon and DUF3426 domain-containing protein [Methyloterricola oryzae]
MYTQCPTCRATFRIDINKLRESRGKVICRDCQTPFNALNALAESPKDFPKAPPIRRPVASPAAGVEGQDAQHAMLPPLRGGGLPSLRAVGGLVARPQRTERDREDEEPRGPELGSGLCWWLGALAMAVLLVWQVNVFEGARLAQNERVRPWLELMCESLGCELSPYKDTRQIQVVDRALLPAPDDVDGYEFRLIIANQSALAQAFPSIRLVLSELGGRPSASRTFSPDEYLEAPRPGKMPVGKPFEIRLLIAKPSSEVGGFSFELI